MARPSLKQDALRGSFLPEDYLRRKAERRSILMSLGIFLIVVFCVVAAFFVTNRQWSSVKAQQVEINAQYAAETKKIEQLKALETQRAEMTGKAEVTTALIEKVPRSILLAELINRMPKRLTLSEFNIKSKRIVETQTPGQASADGKKPAPRSLAGPQNKSTIKKAEEEKPKVMPTKFEFRIEMLGLAADDTEVADYYAALGQCPLLDKVELLYSGETTVDDVSMRKFRIDAVIRTEADARTIEPLHVPRLNSMPGTGVAGAPVDPKSQAADKSHAKPTANANTKE
jgi:Tfp pilus assembly protein PilN